MALLHAFQLTSCEAHRRLIDCALRSVEGGGRVLNINLVDISTGGWFFSRWLTKDWRIVWETEGNGDLTSVEQQQIDDYLQRLYCIRAFL